MTKQEEIREGIAKIVDGALARETLIVLDFDAEKVKGLKDWTPARQEAHYALRESTITGILSYLHSQGVVIKVEGELPTDKNFYGVAKDNMLAGCYYHGQIDMKEAGYVAVEPIIKEG